MIPNGTRFIGIAPEVDLTERGSALLNKRTEPYTIDDIRGYKVFTALLTQSGASNDINQTSGTFDIGVTYFIDTYNAGDDFSNIGGPAAGPDGAWDGYSFVATGTTPLVYTNGTGIDHNTGAPVVTVLENTIGNIWFTYVGVGSYQIPFEACAAIGLTTSNSACFINNNTTTLGITAVIFDDGDGPLVQIYTLLTNGDDSDSVLGNSPIEIRVYN